MADGAVPISAAPADGEPWEDPPGFGPVCKCCGFRFGTGLFGPTEYCDEHCRKKGPIALQRAMQRDLFSRAP